MQTVTIDRTVLALIGRIAPEAPVDSLDARRPFRDQFDFDSVDFLTFILTLEKETGLPIPELDYPRLSSLQGCRDYFGNA